MKKYIFMIAIVVLIATVTISTASTFSLEGCKTYLDSLHGDAINAILAYFDGSGSYADALNAVMSYFGASC